MAEYNISNATSFVSGDTPSFIVNQKILDAASPNQDETYWYFADAPRNYGYYTSIPELKSAVDALAKWVVGKGWTVRTTKEKVELESLTGWGEDTFDNIMWNMLVVKKICGDSFAEIVREKEDIVNIIPISPERVRLVANKKGRIKRYDVWNGEKWVEKKSRDILHFSNDRIGDQIHGTSIIDAVKWVIDARNEALETNKLIEKRSRALGIAYYKTDNTGKIAYANAVIETAVKEGKMLGLPEGTVEIKDFPQKSVNDRLDWIRYLENFFYQVLGIPKILLGGSEAISEGSSKMTTLTFEQIYISEQRQLEQDLWNQLAIKIVFTKPVSIADNVQINEAKNTSQTTLQPKDTNVTGGNE